MDSYSQPTTVAQFLRFVTIAVMLVAFAWFLSFIVVLFGFGFGQIG